MITMKPGLRCLLFACVALLSCGALHAQTCTSIAGSATITSVDVFGSNADVSGSVSFSCSRTSGTTKFPSTFWIGTSGANASRKLGGTDTLSYNLFTGTICASATTQWSGTTGITASNSLTSGADTSVTISNVPFCFRIPSGQNTAKPLTFTGTETLTVRSTNSTGTTWGTGTLSLSASVMPRCLLTSPTTLSFAYTSFAASARPATSSGSFVVQCTNTTSYSLSLDQVTATVSTIGLTYSLGLGTVGTQTLSSLSGTGNTVTYQVPGSMAAGQAGTCAGTVTTCTGTDSRTVTISY